MRSASMNQSTFLLFLAFSSVLLVNFEATKAHPIHDSLPSLVIEDEPAKISGNGSEVQQQAAVDSSSKDLAGKTKAHGDDSPAADVSTKVVAKAIDEKPPEEKLISYETKSTSETSKEVPEKPKEAVESPTTSKSIQATSQPISDSAAPEPTSSNEKDINVLLANNNDAENDLASPARNGEQTGRKQHPSNEDKQDSSIDLDSPVDTLNKPTANNGDRFHYSIGQHDKAEEKPAVESAAGTSGHEAAPGSRALGGKKEDPHQVENEAKRPEEAPSKPTKVVNNSPKQPEEADNSKQQESSLEGKKVDYDDNTKSIVVESVEPAKKSESAAAPESPASEEPKEKPVAAPIPDQVPAASTAFSSGPTTTAPTASSTATEVPQKADETLEKRKQQAEEPSKEKGADESELASSTTTTTTTTSTSTTTTTATPTKSAEKPPNVPSILAVALGTALGAAVGKPSSTGKTPTGALPTVTSNSSTPTVLQSAPTTKIPASSSSTTTSPRKSSTDKWDRWTPSSTSSPPTRRRPILPSIRRRFKPYNRFSPFPWGGADSYSPIGTEPDFLLPTEGGDHRFGGSSSPARPSFSSSSSTTYKPRRRVSSTEPSKTTNTGQPEESDDERPPQESSRRRGSGESGSGNKRRHHQQPSSPVEPVESSYGVNGGRRRYNHHNHNRQHGYDSYSPSSFGDSSPFDSRPPFSSSPPGFGLFNAGPVGSGFDLLNPISWLGEFDKHRPHRGNHNPSNAHSPSPPFVGSAGRPGGRQPMPVEGDYNEGSSGVESNQGEHGPGQHGHTQGHRGGYGGGRDDYHDHHQGHDCHNDYDPPHHDHHREPYRPQPPLPHRPHRDPYRPPVRPPIGGDYDTYPSRPGRPYNRRDQESSSGTGSASSSDSRSNNNDKNKEVESSEASPSLYGSGNERGERATGRPSSLWPVAPKRIPSIFSPFDSLFGAIDEGLFGLRSSFVDAAKASSDGFVDALVSSPKIVLPNTAAEAASPADKAVSVDDKQAKSVFEDADFGRRTRAFG